MEDPPLEVGTPRKHRTASPSARLLHRWPGRSHQQLRLAYSIMRNDNENSVSWGGLCPLKTPVLESEPPEPGHVTLCGTRGVAAYGTCEDEVTLQGVGGPVSSRTGVLVRRETQREGHVRTRAGLGARRPHAKVTPKTVGGHQKLGDSRRRSEPVAGARPARAAIADVRPPGCERINCCCFQPPSVRGHLLPHSGLILTDLPQSTPRGLCRFTPLQLGWDAAEAGTQSPTGTLRGCQAQPDHPLSLCPFNEPPKPPMVPATPGSRVMSRLPWRPRMGSYSFTSGLDKTLLVSHQSSGS